MRILRPRLALLGAILMGLFSPLVTPLSGQFKSNPSTEGRELENFAIFVPIRGEITAALCERTWADTQALIDRGVQHIVYTIDSPAGDTAAALQLARDIHRASSEEGRFRSYAAIENDAVAFDGAALIAIGCESLIFGKNSRLGNFDLAQPRVPLQDLRSTLVDFARANPHVPEAIVRSWVTPGQVVYELRSRNAAGESRRYATEEEVDRYRTRDTYEVRELDRQSFAIIDDERALEYKITPEVFAARTLLLTEHPSLRNLSSLEVDEALGRRVEFDGRILDTFKENPFPRWLKFLLILIGVVGLVVELKLPGTFIGGSLFSVCFVLFFLEGYANQMVGWTEIILFPLAFVLIVVELFVIPGFGVAGILGLGLLFTSLTLGLLPENEALTWGGVTDQLFAVIMSLFFAAVAVLLILRFLPGGKSIAGGGLISTTRLHEDGRVRESSAGDGEDSALVGARGIVRTALRPAGKIAIDGETALRDVVAAGSFIARDTRVEVIEVEGNRIVVDVAESDTGAS